MRITLKKGQDPQLKIPTFLCDKPLKENVPSPYHLLTDAYKFILFLGRPGSGKTSHMISLFRDKRCLRKVWNHVILVMPEESLASMKKESNIFSDIHPSKRYTDLKDIDVIREQVKDFAANDENSVIVIDDQMAKLKLPDVERVLTDIIANRRHYRCSIIMLTQIYERVPLKIRKLVNNIIVQFRPSKKELAMMFDETLENEELAHDISTMAFKNPFDWLMIDVPSQRLFAKFDELVIIDDA